MKQGNRKLILGMLYLVVVFVIAVLVVVKKSGDLYGVSALAAGLASGVFSIVWGNAQEWKSQSLTVGKNGAQVEILKTQG
jgi:membrane protease YdiL (CAAX protease family)